MTNNVIVFPKMKRDTPPQSLEELHEKRETVKREHAEMVLDDVMSNVFYHLSEEGFDMSDDDCIKTTALLIESMRSAMYKSVDIFHPLHDIADSMFQYESQVEEEAETQIEVKDESLGE